MSNFVRVAETVDGEVRHRSAHVSELEWRTDLKVLKQPATHADGSPLPPKFLPPQLAATKAPAKAKAPTKRTGETPADKE